MPTQQEEVERNYHAFKEQLANLSKTDYGKTALMHNGGIVALFETGQDAIEAGKTFLPGKLFSIQKVSSRPIDLGYFSHVRGSISV